MPYSLLEGSEVSGQPKRLVTLAFIQRSVRDATTTHLIFRLVLNLTQKFPIGII
jgi:hypothetical protein